MSTADVGAPRPVIAMMCFRSFSWVMDLADATATTTSRAAVFAARLRDHEQRTHASIALSKSDHTRPHAFTRPQVRVATPAAPMVDG